MKRVIRGSSDISKSIDWDDLIPYEYSFEVDWRSAPNPTFGDDVLALMKEKWDSYVSSQHTKRDGKLSKKTKQYLIRFYLPEIQVDDYFNGSIRIPMPLPEDFIKSATTINSTLWSQLNGTEQSAAEHAISEIQRTGISIEQAVSYACSMYSYGNAEPEYAGEDFSEEDVNRGKVWNYVNSYLNDSES